MLFWQNYVYNMSICAPQILVNFICPCNHTPADTPIFTTIEQNCQIHNKIEIQHLEFSINHRKSNIFRLIHGKSQSIVWLEIMESWFGIASSFTTNPLILSTCFDFDGVMISWISSFWQLLFWAWLLNTTGVNICPTHPASKSNLPKFSVTCNAHIQWRAIQTALLAVYDVN